MEVAALVVAAVAVVVALFVVQRASALSEETSRLRERVARLEERSVAPARAPTARLEPNPDPDPNPVPAPAPAPESDPDPVPAPEAKKPAAANAAQAEFDRLMRGHAVSMVRGAYEMTAYLGFEAIPDSKRAPTVYRVVLDLKSELERDTAKWLSENPLPCLTKVEARRDNKLVLFVDKAKPPPDA